MDMHQVAIHGHRIAYRLAGDVGPTLLCIHGITQDSSTWEQVGPSLADVAQVIAIDLPGHGDSDNPLGDHSLGAYASTCRDLLFALDRTSATVVGHSLGGGVALQFAYQFPELVDRIVLLDSGGLGTEVSPLLRAAALPGADPVIRLLATPFVHRGLVRGGQVLERLGLRAGADLEEVAQGLRNLSDPAARHAFIRTVRATIGVRGQRVSARDKLYLAEHIPTLLLWGTEDRIIPVEHGRSTHEAIPNSRFETLPGVGHFPQLDAPAGVASRIRRFLQETDPARVPNERWGDLMRTRHDP